MKIFATLSGFEQSFGWSTAKVGIIQYRRLNAENQEETHRFGQYANWPPTATHFGVTQLTFGLVVDARVEGAWTVAEGFVNVVIFD